MPRVSLPGYTVTIEADALHDVGTIVADAAPAYRYAVITDDVVGPLYAERIMQSLASVSAVERCVLLTVPAGERLKTREIWARLTDDLLERAHGRDTTIIALGGGVIGDLAGFVAATYMRGIPFVQLPTSLLAMVDASVGGKTGVDTSAGKNLVGAFHRPAAVVIDPNVLGTLPVPHLRAGLAEVLKHGVIADAGYFHRAVGLGTPLARGERVDPVELSALIAQSVEIKADVVRRDERESGLRQVLNFGHTIGHAIEALSNYTILHGDAVSVGMAVESRVAACVGIAEPGTAEAIRDALRAVGLPVAAPEGLTANAVMSAARSDKKSRSGELRFALPRRIGEMAFVDGWGVSVDSELVHKALRGDA